MWCMLMHLMGHSDHQHQDAHSGAAGVQEAPLEVLKRRFALGEITRQQFDEMSQVLVRADRFVSENRYGR